jgi:4-amino-4-deoxy-L-arabinose transferase-like glycosyltransferase
LISRIQSFGLVAAIVVVYIISGFVDVMEVDAAQYASIAREMLERGEYLQVTNRYVDYLDKPPLLFWLSALSFKVFGISNVAFKLPSLLFAIVGIF